MTRRSAGLAVGAALAAALLAAPDAFAHGFVGREDLPIPRWLFGWAATAVLVVSFVALAVLWPKAQLEGAKERTLVRVPKALEILPGALGVALFAIVVWAGFSGTQSTQANLAPTFVWVLFWVGVPVLSFFIGDWFRAVNPWRAVGRAGGWVAKRVAPQSLPEPLAYPDKLGRWPAAVGIVVLAWIELAVPQASRNDPSVLAWLILAYGATMLVGMAMYGVEQWTRNADPFAVYFRFVGSMSPLHWEGGTIRLRKPFTGLTQIRGIPGTVALLAVLIGSTTFDGLSGNDFWTERALDIADVLEGLGLSDTRALTGADTVGLLLTILACAGLFWLGVLGMRTVDQRFTPIELARRFAHSLVPIAFAYVLAHYFSLLAYQGQAAVYLASDPRGRGTDLFGTATETINYEIVGANGIWYVQVAALVIGHVAGLVLAHDRALVVFSDVKRATRSQYWMLAVMVAFTSLGLWLLSSSNG
ncbi:MAG TPA: fenitrothion hydrolase [Solirubrobacteraceae bacterium]|nr:fenitrothion hydrolase [Solirubrobacteraceae bacterium]